MLRLFYPGRPSRDTDTRVAGRARRSVEIPVPTPD
jgi:hypothetical protein